MNRKLNFLAIASLVLSAVPARAQTAPAKDASAKAAALPTVDEIAEKCAKGSGGKEAWAKLSSLVMTGTMEIPSVSMSGKIEIYAKAPNKNLQIVTLADGQFVQKQGFDGKNGWKSDPQSGLKKLEGEELEEARTNSAFDSDVRLKEVFPDMKVTGKTKVGDRDAYTVLTHVGGKTVTFYFDAQTGLRIAMDSEGGDNAATAGKVSLFFEDFRTVAGVQVPHRIRGSAAAFGFEIRIQEVKPNEAVNEALFAMPAQQ